MAFKMKKSKATFDFGAKNQGLNKAKTKARKNVAQSIFTEDASHKSLMSKGKKLGQAFSEIQKYKDY
jgi:hypothetical protein|tara:strand:+ start:411 stop:611 length:201 start_codon:yes stop_codon:yes gene_type:complete